MEKDLKEKVELSIKNLKDKNCRIYFLTQDTKGNAKASVRFIYQMAMALKKKGFNPIILHEKNDYTGVSSWLDSEYMEILPHKSLESQNLDVSPEDFLIVPEIFGYIMEQIKSLPLAKVVLTQAYRYMLETLQPGQSWSQFGFLKCITTSEKQKQYIDSVMKNTSIDIIEPYISDNFQKRSLPPMPIIGVHSREQSDTINLIKTFYLKYPQYRWFTFRDMRGLSEKEFANSIKECCLSVWVDRESGFGTFPIESMSCGVPVMGIIPNLPPEWINENNGIWVDDYNSMPDYIADFIQNWLEDNINLSFMEETEKTSEKFKDKNKFDETVSNLFDEYIKIRLEAFESQLTKVED